MTTPQLGVFQEGHAHQHHLEYTVEGSVTTSEVAHAVRVARDTSSTEPHAMQPLVIGFGPALWRRLCSQPMPDVLADFETIAGPDGRRAPATQNDLWIWVQGGDRSLVLDRVLAIDAALRGIARLAVDVETFARAENRDLIGFVDGSANPTGDQARAAALIPAGQAGAGGSFAFTQCWEHDLAAFAQLSVSEQESVVGRTKADSVELEGDAMPATSHVSRTDVEVDGVAQAIYRRSQPFGTAAAHGLHFVAFACTPHRVGIQLERMFGTSGDGLHDRLVEFSRATTGSYWMVPNEDDLCAALGI